MDQRVASVTGRVVTTNRKDEMSIAGWKVTLDNGTLIHAQVDETYADQEIIRLRLMGLVATKTPVEREGS